MQTVMTPAFISSEQKLIQHRLFWRRSNDRPLLGMVFGGWSGFLSNPGAAALWGDGTLAAHMIRPASFIDHCRLTLRRYEALGDDLFHAAQPFAGVPWMEAIAGCRIRRSERHLWPVPNPNLLHEPDRIAFDERNAWILKYLEFLSVFGEAIWPDYPVAQSLVRGPGDVAAALLGGANLPLAMHDAPEKVRTLLARIGDLMEAFLKAQAPRIPPFLGGGVTGQFEMWAPGWALRLQDDAVALLSPALYDEFLAPLHSRLCALSPYNLFHLHTTSLHVLPRMLRIRSLAAIEVSRDEGVEGLSDLLPHLQAIQNDGHPLVVKGRFSEAEVVQLQALLQPGGLCIQVVTDTFEQARRVIERTTGTR